MKEVLYTIPMNDALNEDCECPFCAIERDVEKDLLDFVLGSGSSYMEADVREVTDREGFCRNHFKKMFAYGNTLGNAWILKTHYMKMSRELDEQVKKFKPGKASILKKSEANSMTEWVKEKENSCYICKRFNDTYSRYIATFFHMYKTEADFKTRIAGSKGFCLSHFGDIMEGSDSYLNDKEKKDFYPMMFKLMQDNMDRLTEDVSWMVEKFDYRNKDADWKNSKDAVQRGMQKLKGGFYA